MAKRPIVRHAAGQQAMKLYLVQHGQAYTKEQNPIRPLTEQGRSDVERITHFLETAGIRVAKVVHNGKRRAEQTAEILAHALAPRAQPQTSDLINPNDDPRAFSWQNESWDEDTLVVGHLPFLEKFISELIIRDESRLLVSYAPGTVACLERTEDDSWRLIWMIRPELIK